MNKKVLTPPPEEPENDVLTPKAPSIAFPLANPAVVPEPQVKGSKFALTTTREALIWSRSALCNTSLHFPALRKQLHACAYSVT